MGALAGDPRANAHYMELHKEDVPGAQLHVFLRKNTAAPSARGLDM
jgi:hypothetical protein